MKKAAARRRHKLGRLKPDKPRASAAETLAKAEGREAAEVAKRERLAAGELGLDIYAMREKLATMGLKYV